MTPARAAGAIFANGSIYINNNATDGSATGGSDIIIAKTNSGGFCGFNSAGQSFNASDRNVKENFSEVHASEVLDKVIALPITKWNFKGEAASIQYVGPMAQDFHAAFHLGGSDDKVIHATNAQGVALAAIQGLNAKLEAELKERDETIAAQQAKLADMEARVVQLESFAKAGGFTLRQGAGFGVLVGLPVLGYVIVRRRKDRAAKEGA